LAGLRLRLFLVVSEIFRPSEKKLSEAEIRKTPIDRCRQPGAPASAVIRRSSLKAF